VGVTGEGGIKISAKRHNDCKPKSDAQLRPQKREKKPSKSANGPCLGGSSLRKEEVGRGEGPPRTTPLFLVELSVKRGSERKKRKRRGAEKPYGSGPCAGW